MTTKRLAPLRDEIWALELLARHTAVARWRGQPSCSAREVLQTLDTSPFHSACATITVLPKETVAELEPLRM
jgi:hypothetical protein